MRVFKRSMVLSTPSVRPYTRMAAMVRGSSIYVSILCRITIEKVTSKKIKQAGRMATKSRQERTEEKKVFRRTTVVVRFTSSSQPNAMLLMLFISTIQSIGM